MKYPEGISIILCCHNSSKLLPQTLKYLANLIRPGDAAMELIVVDNASEDDTAAVARKLWKQNKSPFPASFVTETTPGLVYARRRGVAESHYAYLLFVDDDNHLQNDYVPELLSIFRNYPGVAAAGGYNTPVFESEKPFWFSKFQHSFATGNLAEGFGEPHEIGLFGAGLCLRRSALDSLYGNGFKSKLEGRKGESLSSGEDYELCKALKIAGWKIVYAPSLRLDHFILKNRLQWNYFRQLNMGISRSVIYFLAYEYWIDRGVKNAKWTTDLKYTWSAMLLRKWLKAIVLRIEIFFLPGSRSEGSVLLIDYERALIVALDFLRKRKTYLGLKKEIENAVWRKKTD
jgi:glycosyltransferase involved in cell wall biosynthesis